MSYCNVSPTVLLKYMYIEVFPLKTVTNHIHLTVFAQIFFSLSIFCIFSFDNIYLIQSSSGVYGTMLYNCIHHFWDRGDKIWIAKLQQQKWKKINRNFFFFLNLFLNTDKYIFQKRKNWNLFSYWLFTNKHVPVEILQLKIEQIKTDHTSGWKKISGPKKRSYPTSTENGCFEM